MSNFQIPKALPPLPRTYWVVGGKLLAGAYAGHVDPKAHRARLEGLFNTGVRTIVNLMEENETNREKKPFAPYAEDFQAIAAALKDHAECKRFPIVDGHITTIERMNGILDAIDESMEKNRPVYVHCFGGIGRTGSVVCCWLLRHGYVSKETVFGVLDQLRKADVERSSWKAPENATQSEFVLSFADRVEGKKLSNPSPPVLRNDWFTRLTGFSERRPEEVREWISIDGAQLTSKVNGAQYYCGRLEVVTLGELRRRVEGLGGNTGKLKLAEQVGDAKALHGDVSNAGAVFQVASQFNLLEMVSPDVTPEEGIGIYERDPTQGPACAIACGAGTIYRNYFVELDGQIGQSENKQIDCLADIGEALGNTGNRIWKMYNGYALPIASRLKELDAKLRGMSEEELDELRSKLQIGIQWGAQVTLPNCQHLVTQVYCSAMPVAYSGLSSSEWEMFARLILEAAYESTLAVGILNAASTGNNRLFLTLLGGGAFGNDPAWILEAIRRSCVCYRSRDMDVRIVSYRSSNSAVRDLVESIT